MLLGTGCQQRTLERIGLSDSTKARPEQEIWNSTIVLSQNGVTTSKIHAGHIARYKSKTETFLDSGVIVDFYDKLGQHTSTLTSDSAMVQGDQNNLYAYGNVVVVSDSGQVLRTEAIRWDAVTEKIISDTFVTITTALDTLYGIGLVSDGELQNWQIEKPTGKTYRELNLERERNRQTDATKTEVPEAAPPDS